MKKVRLFLMLLMAAMLPLAVPAQSTLTVHDGTNTSNTVPMYVYYFDDFTRSHVVYPASELEDMAGGQISAITFYTTSSNIPYQTVSTVDIYLAEVESTTVSSFIDKSTATMVFQGTVSFETEGDGGIATITFNTPYTYNGGNLLFGCDNTTDAGYKSINFYGENVQGSSYSGSNSSSLAQVTSGTQRNFLPKTTFTYIPGVIACAKPTDLTATNVSVHTADLNWTAGGTEGSWIVSVNGVETTITDNPYQLTNLDGGTAYTVKVKAVCSETEQSTWSNVVNFNTNYGFPFTETFETSTFPADWTRLSGAAEDAFNGTLPTSTTSGWYYTTYGLGAYNYKMNIYNSYKYWLVTPNIDLTGVTAAELNFDLAITDYNSSNAPGEGEPDADDEFMVLISTDNGASWSSSNAITWGTGDEYDHDFSSVSNTGDNIIIPLDSYLGGMIKIAFYGASAATGADFDVHVDNVRVQPLTTCLRPTDVASADVTAFGATISWTDNNNTDPENGWVLLVNDEEVAADANPFTLNTLDPETTYTVRVKAACSATDSSEWSMGSTSFTTLPTCPAPTALTVDANSVTAHGATLSWTAGGEEESWIINYNGHDTTVIDNPFTFDNLTPATAYTVKVAAACSESDTSHWTSTVSFTTECEPVTIDEENVYYEDFEQYESNSFPLCWTRDIPYTSYSSTYPYVYNYSSYAHGGTKLMYMYYYGTSYSNLISTPTFTNDINTLQVSFFARYYSTNPTFVVGVMDGTTFEAVDTITLTSSYEEYTVMFNEYAGNGNRIAFKSIPTGTSSYSSFYVYLDDVTVELIPSCIKPSHLEVVEGTITTTEATISWTDNNNSEPTNGWTLLVNGTEVAADTNPFTLDNLTASTNYVVRVKANCAADDESAWSSDSLVFATACETYVVTEANPFAENFNALTADIPLCWDNEEGTTTNTSHRWNYYATGYTGACLRFNSYGNSLDNTNMLKTPVLDITALATPRVTFMYKNPTGGDFSVFVSTDGGETYTTELATGLTGVTNWTPMSIALEELDATDSVVIVFQGTSNYGNGDAYIYLDNVVVEETPACLAPTNLSLDTVTTTYFQVSWTDNNEETPASWTVAYSIDGGETFIEITGIDHDSAVVCNFDAPLGDINVMAKVKANCDVDAESAWSDEINFVTPPTCPAPNALQYTSVMSNAVTLAWTAGGEETQWILEVNGEETDVITENPFTIDTLSENTNYSIRVRAFCGEADSSFWSNTVTFYTGLCIPAPTSVDGSGITNVTFGQTQVVNNSTHPTAAPFFGDYTAQIGDGAAGTEVTVDVTYSTAGYSSYSYGTIIWVNWNNDVEFTDNEVVYTGQSLAESPTTLSCTFTIPATIPVGTYKMRIGGADTQFDNAITNGEGYNPCLSTTYTIYEDYTLSVTEAPDCLPVANLTATDVTGSSATISWDDQNSTEPELGWTLDINGEDTVVTENPVVLDNLTGNTPYTVQVRANCSATDSSMWSTSITFRTPCSAIEAEGYSEDFSAYTATTTDIATGVMPDCWDYIYEGYDDGGEPHVYSGSDCVTPNDNSLLLVAGEDYWYDEDYGTTNYAIMPLFDDLTGKQLTFSSKMGSTSNGTLTVGYITNIADASTFTALETIASTTTADTNSVIVSGMPANARIAFSWNCDSYYSYYSCAIDDIVIEDMPSCVAPTTLTATGITTNSAVISWTDVNLTAPEVGWTLNVNGNDTLVTENPVTLDNLTAATSYTIKVMANCTTDDESDWSATYTFATMCDVIEVTAANPYHEGFETSGDFGCWSAEIVAGSYNWTHSTSYVAEGSYSVTFSYNGNEARLVSPMFDITSLTTPQLSFSHRQSEYSGTVDDLYVYYRTSPTEDWTELVAYTTAYASMTEEVFTLPDASATYQISFLGHSNDALSIYLDDVNIMEAPTCFPPTDIVVNDITTTSATISWTDNNENAPQAWTINLNGTDTVVTTNPFTFDNLNAATLYTFTIKANCTDDDESALSTEESFSTDCEVMPALGYSEDFNSYTGNTSVATFSVLPVCWADNFSGTDQGYRPHVYNGTVAVNANDNALVLTGGGTTYGAVNYAIMPELDDVNGLEFTFAYKMENVSYGTLYFGYMTNIADATTFNSLGTVTSSTTAATSNTVLENIPAGARLAFKWDVSGSYSYWSCSVDDITIDSVVAEPCATPTDVTVENNIVTWTGDAANYNVTITANGETTTENVTGNSYTVTGLEDSTLVTVSVQAVCDEDNLSDWSEAVEFTYIATGINNYNLTANVFPNPTTGNVTIVLSHPMVNANVQVCDIYGRQISTHKVEGLQFELNLGNLAPGVYMLRFVEANAVLNTVKVVKR